MISTATASAVLVKSTTGMLTAAGIWGFGLSSLVLLVTLLVKQRPVMNRQRIQENAGLRAEFIDEMKELRKEVKELRDENDLLRREIRELHAVIDGMRRENQAAQISGQRVIAETLKTLPNGPKAQGLGDTM